MKINRVRILSLLVLVALLASLPARVAFATQPYSESFHDEFTDFIGDCGDFTVYESVVLDIDMQMFFNRDGEPYRINWHGVWDATFYSPETNNSVAEDIQHFNTFEDLDSGYITQAGLVSKITLPGQGIVYQDVGRIIFAWDDNLQIEEIIFEAGPHPLYNGDIDVICSLLE